MTKNDDWYQKQHDRELKSLKEVMRRISRGVFWIVSVRMDKEMIGSGWRLTVHLRERE